MTNKDVQKMTVSEMYAMFLTDNINAFNEEMKELESKAKKEEWQMVGYILTRLTSKVFDILHDQEQVRIFSK